MQKTTPMGVVFFVFSEDFCDCSPKRYRNFQKLLRNCTAPKHPLCKGSLFSVIVRQHNTTGKSRW